MRYEDFECNNVQYPVKPPRRAGYLEIREYMTVHETERKEVKKQIGAEIREKCAQEIEEFVDCTTDRLLGIGRCREECFTMRRCLRKHENPEFVKKRTNELIAERLENGTSHLRYGMRKKYNRLFHADIPTN